ncbi:hypothetical protein IQ07DRAFT_650811 [Pyrenochaeta sp. DS3sAY3a]|nr:hypothetical protein IQ07DRAFT_650811 [Pyrenochaeta sp. DS3sAY3a]
MSGQGDQGCIENEPCGRKECLVNLVRIRDLQKNQDELWPRLVDLSTSETKLTEQVKSLECIIVSRNKRIEELEYQVKSYNEELYNVTRCHEQCKPNLEAVKQGNESEKVDLEGQIAALLETNTKLLSRLARDRQSVSEHTRISVPASLQSLSRDNDEDQGDTSPPPSPGSVATPESEANELRPSLQAELMLMNSSDASEIDWWDQGSSAEDNDLIPSHDEYNEMAGQDAMGRLPDDGALTEAASLTRPMELPSKIVVHKESALEVGPNCCNSCGRLPEPNDSDSLADQHTSNEHTTKIRRPDRNFEEPPHSHYRFRIAENRRVGEEGTRFDFAT